MQQYLSAEGVLIQDVPESVSDADTLKQCYQVMVRVRLFDKKAVALQRTGQMGTFPSSLGQEAIATGVGHAMRTEDVLCPYYREQGVFFQRNIDPEEVFSYWGGDERGSDFQNNGEDFPFCVPIASQCLHAAGIAAAFRYRRQPRVCVVFCGDGASSKGDFYEALNIAGVWQLPVVFVVNNNQWAISVPRARQTHAETLAQKATAAGFEGLQVDGNDVLAVRYVAQQALEKARMGKGPTLIEALSYRLCDHTTADDASRYNDSEALKQAWKKDPVLRVRRYMMSEKLWTESEEQALITEATEWVADAVARYLGKALQAPESMFDFLYAQLPRALMAQRSEVMARGL